MSGIKMNNPMLAIMIEKGIFSNCPFTLIDVGCSGGIHPAWRSFGNSLRTYGLDPMIDEIARLQELEDNPLISYYPAFVGLQPDHPMVLKRQGGPPRGNDRYYRTSTFQTASLIDSQKFSHEEKKDLNLWPQCRLVDAGNIIGVSEFVKNNHIDNVDFIKIDIDSYDLDVLISCEEIMNDFPVLGFSVEVHFTGTDSELDNTFHNVDRIMRANGYELFGLEVYLYSHKDMPAPFKYKMPGITEYGPPLWGDAVYIKDIASPSNIDVANKLSEEKLLKIAALFEIFGLPDCAAEVLNAFQKPLSQVTPLEPLLNALVPKIRGRQLTYGEYISTFKNDLEKFFPESQSQPILTPRQYVAMVVKTPLQYVAKIVKRIAHAL